MVRSAAEYVAVAIEVDAEAEEERDLVVETVEVEEAVVDRRFGSFASGMDAVAMLKRARTRSNG